MGASDRRGDAPRCSPPGKWIAADMRLIISGGVVVDPANALSEQRDILIEEGVIRAVDLPGSFDSLVEGSRVIESKGLLVTPGSSEELSDALLMLLKNKRYRDSLGRAGVSKAVSCTWERTTDSILDALVERDGTKAPAIDLLTASAR